MQRYIADSLTVDSRRGKHEVNEEEEVEMPRETARRVLQAAAVEAFGTSGAYVTRDGVMQRANMVDLSTFIAIAGYLQEKGWIAEADPDYGVFLVTPQGVDEAMR